MSGTDMRSRVRTIACFVILIGLALGVQTWSALQWKINFDGDEAIIGLMAQHVLTGQVPTYFYAQNYLGSAEAIMSAGFFRLWGVSVPALRASAILLYGVFILLCGLLVRRLWNTQTALIALLVLAFPGWQMLYWTSRSSANFGSLATLGMAALLTLSWRPSQRGRLRLARWAMLGLFLGVAIWVHPLAIIYIVAIGYVVWLGLPEWTDLYGRMQQMSRRWLGVPFEWLSPATVAILAGLVVLAVFTPECEPRERFAALSTTAKALLAIAGVALGAAVFLASQRRKQLLLNGSCLGAGLAVGTLPVWRAWLFYGVAPGSRSVGQCTTGIMLRLNVLSDQLLPAMWGTPVLKDVLDSPAPRAGLWLSILALMLLATGAFLWGGRNALRALLTLRPLPAREVGSAITILLFALPPILVATGAAVYDFWHTRYLVIAWQASAIMLAVFFTRLITRSKSQSLALIGLWVAGIGLVSTVGLGPYAPDDQRSLWDPAAVASLEAYLADNQVKGGYADYWEAYPLDFLTEGQITLATYTRWDRIGSYAETVASLPVQAYVLMPGVVPKHAVDGAAIAQLIEQKTPNVMNDLIKKRLSQQTVLDHRRVGHWDVWLVTDKQPS